MPESIILDPSELTTRTSLDITPWIAQEGPSWGDALIQAHMAEQQVGATPVDYSIPNRQVTIPLSVRTVGGTAFATARSLIQQKVGLWQAQGGHIKRVLASGGTVFADIVNAQLNLSGGWLQAHMDTDIEASLTLECIPDFYEAEETLSDHTETSAAELIFTETTTNGGDFPLGDRVRVVVDDDQGQNQRGLIWSFRSRHYSSASTACSEYEAEELQNLDTATKVAKVGASGGTVVTHGTLSTNWTPVVGTNIGGTSYLTHTGTNRIYARVFSASGTAVDARFVYDVGDLVNPVENSPVTLYDGGTFHILDLGEARLDPPPTGTHRWQGMIQARGDVGTESFSVDKVWIVNQDEGAGVLQAPTTSAVGLNTYAGRDEFNQAAGNLNAKVAPVGGTWATSGDATDLAIVSGAVVERSELSDAANTGRFAILPSVNSAGVYVSIDAYISSNVKTQDPKQGVLARWVDSNNHVMARVIWESATPSLVTVDVRKRVTGSYTTLGSFSAPAEAGVWNTLALLVAADGSTTVYFGPQGTPRFVGTTSSDSALATGGALATGDAGFYDEMTNGGGVVTRRYDNFVAWSPVNDAVMYASQSVELSSQGIIREDTGGTAYGPVSMVNGDLPRIPNQSSAGTAEVFLKASRGDLSSLSDPAIDDISARVYRRASWLTVP